MVWKPGKMRDFGFLSVPLEWVVVFLLILESLVSSVYSSSICPLDLEYVLEIPWDSSACQNPIHGFRSTETCCQTLNSLYGVAMAQHLKQTSFFRLPDLPTSVSCLSDFQSKLNSLSLLSNLTSVCLDPRRYVSSAEVCANITTRQDWVAVIGSESPLDSACWHDLSDLTSCDSCVMAGFRLHSVLLSIDGNVSHSRGCFNYTVLYAAGIANELGPQSEGSLSCIFGVPLTLKRSSESTVKLALVNGSAEAGSTIFAMSCLLGLYVWFSSRRKKNRKSSQANPFSGFRYEVDDNGRARLQWRSKPGSVEFKIQELEKATDKFSPKNMIGRGQFGIVYRGTLQDGTIVAVKKIIESDICGGGDTEFCNEVEIIGRLKHRNLVPLRGYCVTDQEIDGQTESQRYIVYDYMPNGNLNDRLFVNQQKGILLNWLPRKAKKALTWPQRKSIILDVAKGIAYLHYGVKPAIYHRDIKGTNILLDEDMRAKVADFGLAKQSREGQSHFTTRVAGTHGFLAPEYALYGQLTEKSDVYSFGVLILEVMCGRKALELSSSESPQTFLITDWAWSLIKAGKLEQVLDASLMMKDRGSVSRRNPVGIMERFVMVGILCAHVMVALRPTVLDALKMLEGDIEVPEIPDRPIFGHGSDSVFTTLDNNNSRPQFRPY